MQTGITRRIDELGRIVIPKEIRKSLKIRNCDEINISLDGNSIILNKYEVKNDDKVIPLLLKCLGKYFQKNLLLTSRDSVLYTFFYDKKDFLSIINYDVLFDILEKRKKVLDTNDHLKVMKNYEGYFLIYPLIINGDLFGSLLLFSDKNIYDDKIMDIMKSFLENYLE